MTTLGGCEWLGCDREAQGHIEMDVPRFFCAAHLTPSDTGDDVKRSTEEAVDLIVKLTPLFTKKALGLPEAGYTREEWMEAIVGTVLADAWLVACGSLSVEDFQ